MNFFREIRTAREENQELKKKIEQMEQELEKYTGEKENEDLRKILSFKEQFTQETVGCNIIAKDSGNLFETFTINRGSRDGISVNDPVINANGLVGRVSRVDLFTSKVVSIIDTESSVSARLSRTRDLVILRAIPSSGWKACAAWTIYPPTWRFRSGTKVRNIRDEQSLSKAL